MAAATGVADLPLVAGHPALDLVNTVEPRLPPGSGRPQRDHLRAPADLLVWAGRSGLLTSHEVASEAAAWEREPQVAAVSVGLARAVRDALNVVLSARLAGDAPPEAAVASLRDAWVGAVGRTLLRPTVGGVTPLRLVVGARAGRCVADRVACAAVDLLTAVDVTPLRACPLDAGGCGWLFLDHSHGRSRRWCVMADCGARAKARRLTERRRRARSAAAGSG